MPKHPEPFRPIGAREPFTFSWRARPRLEPQAAAKLANVGIGVREPSVLPHGPPDEGAPTEVLIAHLLAERLYQSAVIHQLGLRPDEPVVVAPGRFAEKVARALGPAVALFDAGWGPVDMITFTSPRRYQITGEEPSRDTWHLDDPQLQLAELSRLEIVTSFLARVERLREYVRASEALNAETFQWLPVQDLWEDPQHPGCQLILDGSLVFADALSVERGYHEPRQAVPIPTSWAVVEMVDRTRDTVRGVRLAGSTIELAVTPPDGQT